LSRWLSASSYSTKRLSLHLKIPVNRFTKPYAMHAPRPQSKPLKAICWNQKVEVIVNAWNRNVIPWWLLIPQGVSGAIKKRAGLTPFQELGKHGPIPLGQAVLTSAGNLPFKGIIHVAGIDLIWRASERSIRDSVRNAMQLAKKSGFTSIAFPLIGTGSGGFDQQQARDIMLDELVKVRSNQSVTLVIFKK